MTEITCIIVSHRKPQYVNEAINSVLTQTFTDWHTIIMDSGDLYQGGFFDWIKDDRVEIRQSGETADLRKTTAMAPWCFNECFRKNLVKGNLVTYLCDDDIWYNNAFGVFVSFAKKNPAVDAMYASQDIAVCDLEGNCYPTGERRAVDVMGLNGSSLDCHTDYLQFCHTITIITNNNILWPEELVTQTHADGVFMDRIGKLVPVYPIDIKVGKNRRTPSSTYNPVR